MSRRFANMSSPRDEWTWVDTVYVLVIGTIFSTIILGGTALIFLIKPH